jgi:hypothetical protein
MLIREASHNTIEQHLEMEKSFMLASGESADGQEGVLNAASAASSSLVSSVLNPPRAVSSPHNSTKVTGEPPKQALKGSVGAVSPAAVAQGGPGASPAVVASTVKEGSSGSPVYLTDEPSGFGETPSASVASTPASTPASSAVVYTTPGNKTRAQYSTVSALYLGSNEWLVSGDLAV